MDYSRKDINGTDPIDIKNLNDNFKYLFMKVFNDTTTATTTVIETTPTQSTFQLEDIDDSPKIYASTAAPTANDGENGDVWIQYTEVT